MASETYGFVRPLDKLKTYLFYHNAYDYLLDKLVTYYEKLPHITPLDPSITWSCEVMQQIKYIISPLSQDLWLLNLGEC